MKVYKKDITVDNGSFNALEDRVFQSGSIQDGAYTQNNKFMIFDTDNNLHITTNTTQFTIGTGKAMLGGCLFSNDVLTTWTPSRPGSGTVKGVVCLTVNLDEIEGQKQYFEDVLGTATDEPVLKTDDLTQANGRTHQKKIATYSINSNGTISNFLSLTDDFLYYAPSTDYANKQTLKGTTSATASWWRIASTDLDIVRNEGVFTISWYATSVHGVIRLEASSIYGKVNAMTQSLYETYIADANNVTKARIVYHTTHTGTTAHLEVWSGKNAVITINVDMESSFGWVLTEPDSSGKLPLGSVPTGYTSKELNFVTGISTNGMIKVNNSKVVTENEPAVKIGNYLLDQSTGYLLTSTTSENGTKSFFHYWNATAGDWLEIRASTGWLYGVPIAQSTENMTNILPNTNKEASYRNDKTATQQINEMVPCQITTENSTLENTFDPNQLKLINPDLVFEKENGSSFANQRAIIDMLIIMNQEQQKRIEALELLVL